MVELTTPSPGVYINGSWSAGTQGVVDLVDPVSEEPRGQVSTAGSEQVEKAVAAARAAFADFSGRATAERAQLLRCLAEELETRKELFIDTIVRELGAPRKIAENVHVNLPIATVKSMAELVDDFEFQCSVRNSAIHRVPVGVVAAITPWNYPLHQITAKVIAAFAVGCTVVLKPAEATSETARLFVEATESAGFPPGVINLLCGRGSELGPALVEHPGVDMVSFTGSLQVGREIGARAGAQIKRVTLELGGKSASLLLPDVKGETLVKAVKVTLANCLLNSGQTCTALTRIVVPESMYDEVAAMLKEGAEKYADPARLGPLVSSAQRDTVLGYMRRAEASGAEVVAGGADAVFPAESGWYVAPTVYSRVSPDDEIVQEEVFGPVLVIQTYPDDDLEAGLALANHSQYGLSGAVWAADENLAAEIALRLETGQVDINGGGFNLEAPFGGFKSSGIGRELGRAGLEDYLEYRSLQLPR